MLSELLGRDEADELETEQPWMRIDLKLHATVQLSRTLAIRRRRGG